MKKVSDLRKFHEQLNQAFYDLEREEEFPNHFYQALLSGENEIYQKSIQESKVFHEDWIETIESYFSSLDKITRDPKSGLKYLQEVVQIEKAKKVNSDSIRHLAANTQLIKEVRGRDVIPKQILTTQAEIEYAIYENRFIKTLVDRLFDFVNRRYDLVKSNVETHNNKYFNLKSTFDIRESKINLEVDLKIQDTIDDDLLAKANHELLTRIQSLLKRVNAIRVSPFMEGLKQAKPIIPPIMKTSIILKNVDYNNCYNLWLYLDKYNLLNFDVDIKEQNLTLDRYYLRNVYQTALTAFTNVYGNQKALEDHYQYLDVAEYKRKSPKMVKKSLNELMTSADPYTMEDNQINQFFLEQNKKILQGRIDEAMEESSSYDVALRKALRDTIAISNALFKDFFELEDDMDREDLFFSRMVKQDLDHELLKAKDRARVARIIRETKEVDYNNAIRLEKRMLKDIVNVNKEIQKGLKKRAIEEAKKKAIEERIKHERKNLEKNQLALTEYLEFVAEQKKLLQEDSREMQEKIRLEEKRIKDEEQRIINLEKKKALQKYNAEMQKIKERQKKDKERAALQAKREREKERKKFRDTQMKLKKQAQERIKIQKSKIEKKLQSDLDKIHD
ncbi:MAG: DUF2357 domain-containing protein [Acholeplasmataceae bacterium]|jgi:hypothetical protein|nr:DUF2357 domain-containing protein [Acholeplasmataceae bacterium]